MMAAPLSDPDLKRRFVRDKFAAVAHRYDLLNSVLSLSIDRSWRRITAAEVAALPDGPILDLCAGTLPLAVEIARQRPAGRVFAVDFCPDMLLQGMKGSGYQARRNEIFPVCGDGEELPFPDGIFQGITIAFGIRNLSRTEKGLEEMRRVLVPGGKLAILEFSRPRVPVLGPIYMFYLHKVLPHIGGILSGDKSAYSYLASSIQGFYAPEVLAGMMASAGFTEVRYRPLTLGIVTLYTGLNGP